MDNQDHIIQRIIEGEQSAMRKCESCGRAGIDLQMPTMEELSDLLKVREDFDKYRRIFTPAMAQRMASVDRIAHYISILIHGSSRP